MDGLYINIVNHELIQHILFDARRKEARAMDRQIRQIEREEAKTKREIKKLAKRNDPSLIVPLAKGLVRTALFCQSFVRPELCHFVGTFFAQSPFSTY